MMCFVPAFHLTTAQWYVEPESFDLVPSRAFRRCQVSFTSRSGFLVLRMHVMSRESFKNVLTFRRLPRSLASGRSSTALSLHCDKSEN